MVASREKTRNSRVEDRRNAIKSSLCKRAARSWAGLRNQDFQEVSHEVESREKQQGNRIPFPQTGGQGRGEEAEALRTASTMSDVDRLRREGETRPITEGTQHGSGEEKEEMGSAFLCGRESTGSREALRACVGRTKKEVGGARNPSYFC